MTTLQVFDPAMCCPTGVCGPAVDSVLPRFAADLEWLKREGVAVERFNLAQQAAAFAGNPEVNRLLAAEGVNCLPLILVDGRVVGRGAYPSRQQLAHWTGRRVAAPLPLGVGDGCCGGSSSCG
jgi:hypothetical protein